VAPSEQRVDAEAPQRREGDVPSQGKKVHVPGGSKGRLQAPESKTPTAENPFWPFSIKTVIVAHAGGIDVRGVSVACNVSSRKSSGKKASSGANRSVMLFLAGFSITSGGGNPCR
jgi:hypothetical protein